MEIFTGLKVTIENQGNRSQDSTIEISIQIHFLQTSKDL